MRVKRISSGLGPLVALCSASAVGATETSSKRGLAYSGDDNEADMNLLTSDKSPISWYYTWSLNQAPDVNGTAAFVPLVPTTDEAADSGLETTLGALPSSSTHLLTFNEPDGTTDSGGSSVEPEDAAKAYVEHIAALRTSSERSWNISHPSVTGSERGLEWLRSFNESCYDLDPDAGCPTDFISVHWYGDFAGLTWWLDTLREFYVTNSSNPDQDLPFWVTELALPQQDEDATVAMLNSSLGYLDGLDWVSGYAWFGAFRSDDANDWTGSAVALFDDDGGLTEVGSLYMGGEANGFAKGTKGEGDSSAAAYASAPTWVLTVAGAVVMVLTI
ncbi:glycosyl hydrolase catalytic core-domain-containing protein [Pestalotiopsis sp. NC0098]|nr:glycosyl hydrolase catalytic core-domain-containing protein [Pestalotiopsis sp. NC0098]